MITYDRSTLNGILLVFIFIITGMLPTPIKAQTGQQTIQDIVVSPDGTMIAVAGSDGFFNIRDAASGQVILTLPAPADSGIWSVAWSPDSKRIAAVVGGLKVQVWNIKDSSYTLGALLATLTGHRDYITRVVWSPDGQTIVSESANDRDQLNVKLWNVAPYSLRFETHFSNFLDDLSWSPDNLHVAIGGFTGVTVLNVSAISTDYPIGKARVTDEASSQVRWNKDSNLLAVSTLKGDILIYNLSTGNTVRTLAAHQGIPSPLVWSPDGTLLASFGSQEGDGTIKVWDPITGALLSSQQTNYPLPGGALAWSPDGNFLLYSNNGTTLNTTPPFLASNVQTAVSTCVKDSATAASLNDKINTGQWSAFISEVNAQSSSKITSACAHQLVVMATYLLKHPARANLPAAPAQIMSLSQILALTQTPR